MKNDFKWSKISKKRLLTTETKLQKIVNEALSMGLVDISVTCGHRSKSAQNRAYDQGNSKLRYPKSKHNSHPAKAIDCKPYIPGRSPNWNDYSFMAGLILTVAKKLDIKIRWGGNWDRDGDILRDQSFDDGAHFELI